MSDAMHIAKDQQAGHYWRRKTNESCLDGVRYLSKLKSDIHFKQSN